MQIIVQEQLTIFLGSMSTRVSSLTVQYYGDYIRRFLAHADIDSIMDLSNLPKMEDSYTSLIQKCSRQSGRPLKTETKKKYLKTMSKFCDWLTRREIIGKNPFKQIEKPKGKIQKKPCMKQEDIWGMYAVVNTRWVWYLRERNEMIISFILATGLRRAEVCSMRVVDVEFRPIGAIIHVIGGKWDKDREVFVSDQYAQALRIWIKQVWIYSEYLFPSQRGTPLRPRGLSSVFKIIKDRTNNQIHPHLLRHTYASTLVQKWVSLETVRNNMGHSNLKTTSLYISHNEEIHLDEMRKTERRFWMYLLA